MKRALALLLFTALLLTVCACSKRSEMYVSPSDPYTEETSTGYAGDADAKIADLKDTDWQGKEFRIATDDPTLILPQNGSNFVGKNIYERNRAVEKKFNVKIVLTEESGLPSVSERIRTEALAGSDYCDLAVLSVSACQQLVSYDALQNVATVPYVSTSTRGVFQNATNAMTLGNNVYALCGDLCYSPDSLYAVYFNKVIAAATGLPDLYQLVRDNQWDQENFQLYAEEAYALGRINGQKIYGFTSSQRTEELLQAFWASSDLSYVNNPYGGRPSLVYDESPIRNGFVNQARKVLYKNVSYLNNTAGGMEAFRDGQILFYIAPLSHASELADASADWGVLPLPVYDINQETHRTYQTMDYQVVCFPKGIADIDFSGQITQALFAASEGMSRDLALAEYVNMRFRSAEDKEMLKILLAEPYFDPTEFFGGIYQDYLSSTQMVIQRVVSSEGNFNQLFKQYSIMFDKLLQDKLS